MEQIGTFFISHSLYTATGCAMILLLFMVFILHRMNQLLRLQKKQMKKIQDTMQILLEQKQVEEKQKKEAAGETGTTADAVRKGQASMAAGWTSEQEHLVDEVLDEVFS